jgi:DNA modification methylase
MKPFISDADFSLYVGDVVDVLPHLDPDSVHCVVTSPPYWALRDYGIEPTDWPEVTYSPLHGFELTVPPTTCALGLEPTPEAFVAHLVLVFREIRRVLRPDGTLWLNIGDSYATKKGGDPYSGFNSRWHGYPQERGKQSATNGAFPLVDRRAAGLKHKDMVGIPWLVAFALRSDGWWLRAENIWDKQNPMPESVTDRPVKSHEQLFLLTKSEQCFYDYVAVRETASGTANSRGNGMNPKAMQHADASSGVKQNASAAAAFSSLTARRNLRSVWRVASRPYTGAHFAVFPPNLIEPCILAGTSAHGCCATCGAPYLPVNEKRTLGRHELPHDHPEYRPARYIGKHDETNGGGQRYLDVVTVGWEPSCTCEQGVRPCVVLDPFGGACTTPLVARLHGRHSIAIEKSTEYARLGADRLSQQSLLAEAI